MVGLNLSHITIKQHPCDYLTACGDIFGFQLSHLARLLSTHTPQYSKTPPVNVMTVHRIKFEKATTNEEGLGKI